MINKSEVELNRSFFNLPKEDGPVNEFRNPIWGSDDEDDDDELYHNCGKDSDAPGQRDVNVHIYSSEPPNRGARDQYLEEIDPSKLDEEIHQRVEDAFRTMDSIFSGPSGIFGGVHGFFGDMGRVFDEMERNFGLEDPFSLVDVPKNDETSIRDHYLKPGYRHGNKDTRDRDLDGKISSDDISNLLKRKDHISELVPKIPFDDARPSTSTSYFKSIVTKTHTRPDGTVETRRIVRDQNGNIEETITTSEPSNTRINFPMPYSGPDDLSTADDSVRGVMLSLKNVWKHLFQDDI